ncbi:hypothetical protein [Lysinibacillus sphaericus]|uniref:hypothetical protein n=1 Tax=Lysinibacillus sphaericus TaxID=1421 RepID=UPI000568EA00|nr:hypothetical protein [Lysinibacillus sphaericus]
MERFDMNFQHKIVKIWFLIVLPMLILSIIFKLLFPIEKTFFMTVILIITVVSHWIWAICYAKKRVRPH